MLAVSGSWLLVAALTLFAIPLSSNVLVFAPVWLGAWALAVVALVLALVSARRRRRLAFAVTALRVSAGAVTGIVRTDWSSLYIRGY